MLLMLRHLLATSSSAPATASVTVPAVLQYYYCFSICCSACRARLQLQLSLQLEQLMPRSIADLLQSLLSFRVVTASAFAAVLSVAPV